MQASLLSEQQSQRRALIGFFVAMGLFWAWLAFAWLKWGYVGSYAELGQYHHPAQQFLAYFFFTHLGDGIILPGMLFLFMHRRDPSMALTAVIAMLATGLIVQVLKHGPFADCERPPVIFEGMWEQVHIRNWPLPQHHSFPSGHSASIAGGGLFFAVYLFREFRIPAWFIGLFTAFLCYTRALAGAHFQGDILVGGLIGGIGSLPFLWWVYPKIRLGFGRISPYLLKRIKWGLLSLGVAAIVVQYLLLTDFELMGHWALIADRQLMLSINMTYNPLADSVMELASLKETWIPAYLLLFFGVYKMYQLRGTLIAFLLAGCLILIADQGASFMKKNVERPRPCHEKEEGFVVRRNMNKCGSKYGFFSAHAANFMALATFFSFLYYKRNKYLPWLFFFCAALVAYSRVYLGVHYPGDVLAGSLYGILCGALAILAWKQIRRRTGRINKNAAVHS